MLVLRIIATVLMGISCATCLFKNINIFSRGTAEGDREVVLTTIYGCTWRAFVIVALWLI